MTQDVKYGLTIRHLTDGFTKLESLTRWAVYDAEGKIADSGIISRSEEDLPLPVQIAVFGVPTRTKMTQEQFENIKQEFQDTSESASNEFIKTKDGKEISSEHRVLFEKLKACLKENAPKDGHYALDLRYYRDEEQAAAASEAEASEHEIVDPDDIQLAMILAFLCDGLPKH